MTSLPNGKFSIDCRCQFIWFRLYFVNKPINSTFLEDPGVAQNQTLLNSLFLASRSVPVDVLYWFNLN